MSRRAGEIVRRVAGRYWPAAALCLLAALAFGGGQLRRELSERARASWPETTATVVRTEVWEALDGAPRLGGRIVLHTEATFAYEVDGVDYETATDIEGLGSPEGLELRLPPGARAYIRYDPDDPERIHFDIGDVTYVHSDLTWFVVTLILAGIGLILVGRWSRSRQERAEERG